MLAFLFLVYGSVTSSGISYGKNFRATALEGAELGIPLKTRKWNSSLRVFWARDQALLGERARATLAEVGAGRRLCLLLVTSCQPTLFVCLFDVFSLSAHHRGDSGSWRWPSPHPGHRPHCYLLQVSDRDLGFKSRCINCAVRGSVFSLEQTSTGETEAEGICLGG